MKIVFVSNYFNHHQEQLSKEFSLQADEYYFVATTPINKERIKLGYEDMNEKYPFIIRAYESEAEKERAISLINDADFVITGSAPEEFIAQRLKQNKIVFRYTERIYKDKQNPLKFPFRFFTLRKKYHGYKNQYLLCSSAYTSYDFSKSRSFINKAYKWGYFPETRVYDNPQSLIDGKDENSILWVGRLIDWKHPEFAVMLASRLREDGYPHKIKIVGTGEMEDELKLQAKGLDNIEFLGGFPPDKVREIMEKSEIFLFTSNKKEGWGAVLNEAMNARCAVVCSHACGATPYLISDGENGLIFESENFSDFYKKVRFLIDNPKAREEIRNNAYSTIKNEWNAKVACDKLITLINEVLSGNKNPNPFNSGVCSKAEIIKDNWYKTND